MSGYGLAATAFLLVALTLAAACSSGSTDSSPTASPMPSQTENRITPSPTSEVFTASPAPTPRPTDFWTPTDAVRIAPTQPPVIYWTPEPTPAPPAQTTPEPTQAFQEGPNYELAQGITERINQKRQELGINQLTVNSAIVSAANEYAKFLYNDRSHPLDHNLDGLDPTQRAQKYGYDGGAVLEILMGSGNPEADYFTPEIFMDGWVNSPAHYNAMINPLNSYIGVGCYQGLNQLPTIQMILTICVGNFGRLPQTLQ